MVRRVSESDVALVVIDKANVDTEIAKTAGKAKVMQVGRSPHQGSQPGPFIDTSVVRKLSVEFVIRSKCIFRISKSGWHVSKDGSILSVAPLTVGCLEHRPSGCAHSFGRVDQGLEVLRQEVSDDAADTGFKKGLMTAMITLDAFIGALNQGWIAGWASRKRSIMIAVVVFIMGSSPQTTTVN
ncbi:hypothetical protein B0J13DRAFT_531783 [Dactylonectria estremocensis]|uniref:Major facilitator superfamily (MFS) profile domain-containing protein n=1 Tax=Dactylonectria estremocensis TaxID=1079267 RepID=A0A9P9DNF3_9HYPO|nr:hypothetical protein B0J13DRAFT_531783 [Dactylonectria estremocensis]